jgi:tRNA(adenine34) deaminase
MTTVDPDTLERDPEVLRDIGRRFGGRLTLNAAVVRGGTIRVGDTVRARAREQRRSGRVRWCDWSISWTSMTDERYMRRCLELGRQALDEGEVPVGAVIVEGDQIIGEGREQTRALADPTAHAEVRALVAACHAKRTTRLESATLYSTVEPCVLCGYAIRSAGVARVVYGLAAGQLGAYRSTYALLADPSIPGWRPPPAVYAGVLATECGELLRARRAPCHATPRLSDQNRTDPPLRFE